MMPPFGGGGGVKGKARKPTHTLGTQQNKPLLCMYSKHRCQMNMQSLRMEAPEGFGVGGFITAAW